MKQLLEVPARLKGAFGAAEAPGRGSNRFGGWSCRLDMAFGEFLWIRQAPQIHKPASPGDRYGRKAEAFSLCAT